MGRVGLPVNGAKGVGTVSGLPSSPITKEESSAQQQQQQQQQQQPSGAAGGPGSGRRRGRQRRAPAPTEVVASPEILVAEDAVGTGAGGTEWQERLARAASAPLRQLTALPRERLWPAVQDLYARSEPVLRVEEQPLTYPLLGASAALWTLCVAVGLALHAGAEDAHTVRRTRWLPLLGFDRQLRLWGVLLAAPALGLRYAANAVTQPDARGWLAARPSRHFAEAAAFYAGLSLLRAAVYLLHVTRVFQVAGLLDVPGGASLDVMSDHFFLASCIAAVLTAEGCLAVVERRRSRHPPARNALLLAALGYAALVFVLLCGDMLFTAWYFHGRHETLWGALWGLSFPLAAGTWLLRNPRV